MIEKTIEQIANMIPVLNDISSISSRKIKGVSMNTKTIETGNLFIPLKGERRDGHEFVEQAIEQGASASLWQKDVPNPPTHLPIIIVEDTLLALQELARSYRNELDMKVVAVTGSNGKTTTKDILAQLLSLRYNVQKTQGNYNNHIGLPLTILALKPDTEVAVLEMGMSNFGEIQFLSKLAKPDAAIITNIGEAHLQELGSRAGIAKAKMEILDGLKDEGLFVFPGDESLIRDELKRKETPWVLATFGRTSTNDLYPVKIEVTRVGSSFQINRSDITFQLPVLGEYNVLNALAAMTVAYYWGIPYEQMNQAFSQIKLTKMRMEISRGIFGSQILNDAYNASPTSMKAVVDLVSQLSGFTKKIVVLGDMLELGPKEKEFHLEIGEYLDPEKICYVYTYGKLGKWIADGAKKKFPETRVFSFLDKMELVDHLRQNIDEQTFVLVKASRSMKMEEVVEAIKEEI